MCSTQTNSRFQAFSLASQVLFPLSHQLDSSTHDIAAAAAIQLEIGSGKFDFTLHGAAATHVMVDHNHKSWTCSDGAVSSSLSGFLHVFDVGSLANYTVFFLSLTHRFTPIFAGGAIIGAVDLLPSVRFPFLPPFHPTCLLTAMHNSQSLETAFFPCHFYTKPKTRVLALPLVCHRSCFSLSRRAIGAFVSLASEGTRLRLRCFFTLYYCKSTNTRQHGAKV